MGILSKLIEEKYRYVKADRQDLTRALVNLHKKYPAMGLDSLYHMLRPDYGCSRRRVHRLMGCNGIHLARTQGYKATTNVRHSHPIAPNLLQRGFSFEQPNQTWVGDATYIPTGEGWLYLSTIKDLSEVRAHPSASLRYPRR